MQARAVQRRSVRNLWHFHRKRFSSIQSGKGSIPCPWN